VFTEFKKFKDLVENQFGKRALKFSLKIMVENFFLKVFLDFCTQEDI
jgi:hypothetical protein